MRSDSYLPRGEISLQALADETWNRFRSEPNEETFGSFYTATHAYVIAIGLRILGSDDEVDDLVQNVYRELVEVAIDSGRASDINNINEYVRELAKRLAERCRKQRYRESLRRTDVEDLHQLPSAGMSAAEIAEKAEMREKVRHIVALLPETYRLPILLHYFSGMSHGEIAEALGVGKSAVTKRIGEGIRRLEPLMANAGLGDALTVLGLVLAATEWLGRGMFKPAPSLPTLSSVQRIARCRLLPIEFQATNCYSR